MAAPITLGDEYALLSFAWCDLWKLPIEPTGVIVKPAEVRSWLRREAGGEDPYRGMLQTHGPAFLSVTRIVNPPQCEIHSSVQVPGEELSPGAGTREHPGFGTWRLKQVSVVASLPMTEVLKLAAAGFKQALTEAMKAGD